jgi:hypothetical protein
VAEPVGCARLVTAGVLLAAVPVAVRLPRTAGLAVLIVVESSG